MSQPQQSGATRAVWILNSKHDTWSLYCVRLYIQKITNINIYTLKIYYYSLLPFSLVIFTVLFRRYFSSESVFSSTSLICIFLWNNICYVFEMQILTFKFTYQKHGAHGGVVVKGLRYKPAGRGFDFRWCQDFSPLHNPAGRTMALGSTQPLTEMSTRCVSCHQ